MEIKNKLIGLSSHLLDVISNLVSPDFNQLPLDEKKAVLERADKVQKLGEVIVKAAFVECKHKELDIEIGKKPIPINSKTIK